MKKIGSIFVLTLIMSSLLFISCKKNSDSEQLSDFVDESTVSILKSWVISNKQTATSIQKVGIDSLLGYANWQNSEQTKVSNGKSIIYVPIKNSTIGLEFFYNSKSKNVDSGNIVQITDYEKSSTFSFINSVKSYYEKVILGKEDSNLFSGKITAYSITNKFLYTYLFQNGKIKGHGLASPKHTGNNVIKTNDLKVTDGIECELWGLYVFWDNGTVTLEDTWVVCTDGSCQPPSLSISYNSGLQYVKTNCAPNIDGNGGSFGGGSIAALSAIKNNLTKQCIKSLADKIGNSDFKDKMSTSLRQSFVSPGSTSNLVFVNGDNLKDNDGNIGKGYAESHKIIGGWEILVNESLLQNSTQEFVMSVFAHEIGHYYSTQYFQQKDIFRPDQLSQHSDMFQNWVTSMSGLLQSTFGSSLSLTDANALALGGMDDLFTSILKPADPAIVKDYWNSFAIKNYGISTSYANAIRNQYMTKNRGKGTPACF